MIAVAATCLVLVSVVSCKWRKLGFLASAWTHLAVAFEGWHGAFSAVTLLAGVYALYLALEEPA